jgi:hypothetical protein
MLAIQILAVAVGGCLIAYWAYHSGYNAGYTDGYTFREALAMWERMKKDRSTEPCRKEMNFLRKPEM